MFNLWQDILAIGITLWAISYLTLRVGKAAAQQGAGDCHCQTGCGSNPTDRTLVVLDVPGEDL